MFITGEGFAWYIFFAPVRGDTWPQVAIRDSR